MTDTKIIAMYLPQFHCIPENDEFWGKGFTDWVTVRKAKPLFEGHKEPKVPLNDNYYDLSVKEHVAWQAKIAKENGIYGFGAYHYWFNNEKNLLTKPTETIRDNKDIDINYFFVWDNCLWKRSWSNVSGNAWSPIADEEQTKEQRKGPQVLIPYILGEEPDWENHYNYVKTHFKEDRYIKIDGKPVFCIINYGKDIQRMCDFWDKLAKKDGYPGMHFIFKFSQYIKYPQNTFCYNYEPHSAAWNTPSTVQRYINFAKRKLGINFRYLTYDYDKIWKKMIKYYSNSCPKNVYPGAFINYDDSPRRGNKGSRLFTGFSVDKFHKYLKELYSIARQNNKEFIFLTAWNEWGEGAYLEPDNENGYKYLEAIKSIVEEK
ncbi:glycoside hydrolase family 99-like domain-containing protein [Bacteroides sp. ET336]|uniref:glycosyltransferase WbsX family protein n=1 Tax=Bacteroides sp. ET336 TaxID=2972459 RepID=UPI0021AC847F|nr:glycoside hydrolase family 99-like domain-containing protein [Bacteroides sp. ET336]MCR8894221.1 glycoside hydrolase family 99-like domain-containing protein [Bacteroides sp. ET336]MDN0058719.1 glycoside hydrolase family 99-like domain-containing protein [Bacteroides caecigallinarum]